MIDTSIVSLGGILGPERLSYVRCRARFSRIAVTRNVDVELVVRDALHMHHAPAGVAEVRPASGAVWSA